jgi:hypothetical protein
MLFQPASHEALADEPWSADIVRAAIASIVTDVESAFDDGWPLHPEDKEKDDDPAGTSAQPSTSPTASTAAGSSLSRS